MLIPKLNKVFKYSCNGKYKPKDIKRFISKIKINKENECWEWYGFIDRKGYGKFNCTNECCEWIKNYAHRVSKEMSTGKSIPEGIHTCHRCDNRKCVNPKHLFLGTNKDNMNDRDNKKRVASGENNGQAKLTWKKINEIRRLWNTKKYTQKQLSKKFLTSIPNICRIINNQLWIK